MASVRSLSSRDPCLESSYYYRADNSILRFCTCLLVVTDVVSVQLLFCSCFGRDAIARRVSHHAVLYLSSSSLIDQLSFSRDER